MYLYPVYFLYSQTSIDAGGSAHFLIRLFCLRDLPKVYGKSALQAFETKCKFEMYTPTNAAGYGQNIGVRVYTSTHTTGYGLNLFLHFFSIFWHIQTSIDAGGSVHFLRRLFACFQHYCNLSFSIINAQVNNITNTTTIATLCRLSNVWG